MIVFCSGIRSFFHDRDAKSHGCVVADEDGVTFTKECIGAFERCFDLGCIIAVLHFDDAPTGGLCDPCEVCGNRAAGHITQLDIIEVPVNGEIVEHEMGGEAKGFLHLSLLAVAIGEEDIDSAGFL
ncbi:hypothetical protein A2635_02505 [Candidatus Peribacteria bacterium RIFCSPHIGHO2_01_FULL_51_9]|nr:MAG: hypothetical protein A2635_02505 [Candidatus Peribacteria bacterium RIFCSPHIGHO2_01_FULL_51_9]